MFVTIVVVVTTSILGIIGIYELIEWRYKLKTEERWKKIRDQRKKGKENLEAE